MKHLFFFLLFFLLFQESINDSNNTKVVNSCGNDDLKYSNNMPKVKEDCEDKGEPFCKYVKITKDNISKAFCAIIHGKYNDKSVLDEVKKLIKADEVSVSGSSTYVIKYIIYLLFTIFLF